MSTRIYRVISRHGDKLVRAASQAQAIRHVVANSYTAKVATQDDILSMLESGCKVLDATKDESE